MHPGLVHGLHHGRYFPFVGVQATSTDPAALSMTMAQVLADFWWAHLVPAKHALAAGDWELVDTFRPDPGHAATKALKEASQRMVAAAPRRDFET